MNLTELRLDNFRSYRHAAVAFDRRITLVGGPNGVGKSSLVDSLLWAITGACRGTDARGVGSDTLIRATAAPDARMRVELEVEGVGDVTTITRVQHARTQTLRLNGEVTPASKDALTGRLFERLGVSPEVVRACLSSEAFLNLHHKDAKDLLLDVCQVRVTLDGEPPMTLGQIDAAYAEAVERRRAAKQRVAECKVPPMPEGDLPDVAALERDLSALRDQEKAVLTTTAAASGQRAGLDRQIAALEQDGTAKAKILADLSTTRALDGAPTGLEEAIRDLQDRLATDGRDERDDRVEEQRLTLVDAQGRLRLLEEQVTAIEGHAPTRGCVLNAAIPCKTPAKHFTEQLGALRHQIEALAASRDAATKAVEDERARLAARDRLQKVLARLQEQARTRARVQADLDIVRDAHARLTAERDALPADVGPSPPAAALTARIAKGEQVVARAREVARQAAEHQAFGEEAKRRARELAAWERRCDELGPNGARARALTDAVASFEAQINGSLERFGYRLRLVVDPWTVVVNDLPAELLSTSERLRVGLSLQLALAEVSGFGFVAIDQVDLLDAGNRAVLAELVTVASGVQVLLACTKDADWDPTAAPAADWSLLKVTKTPEGSVLERVGQAVPV